MSKLGLVIVLILMAGKNNAQDYTASADTLQDYFVLIQADNNQAFYVRLDSQLYTSSPAGHLILSQLKDSNYTVTIGFPGQVFPEQRFVFSIHQKDQAFRLKNEDGRRWGLYDEQGQPLKMAAEAYTSEPPLLTGVKKDDAFSRLMAALVSDTAVMYNTYALGQPLTDSSVTLTHPLSDSTHTPLSPDSSSTTLSPVPPPSSAALPPPYHPSAVVKLSEHKSSRALRLVYADQPSDKKADTIIVIIPIDSATPSPATPSPVAPSSATPSSATTPSPAPSLATRVTPPATQAPTSGAPATLASATPTTPGGHGPNTDSPALSTAAASHPKPALPFVNSDCHAYATDYDVDRLRVKMLEAAKDDDRIQAARKVFKTKCFSTHQIRALSEVFSADASRFRFLEAAYPFVSDSHFPELVNLLTDPVYSGRFRTMTDRH
jgi:hypothetical protein